MKIFKHSLAVLSLSLGLFGPSLSRASVLIEPYLGYGTGSHAIANQSDSMSGAVFGARLGLNYFGLMGGLGYMTGSWSDSATSKNTIVPSDFGIFVGYNFPVLLRVYGTYGFSSARKYSNSGTSGSGNFTGSDVKLGIGFSVLPLLSINLEYIAGTFTKQDGNSLNSNLTDKMYALTVSLPLTF